MEAMIYHRAFVMQDNLRNLECGSVCVVLILILTDVLCTLHQTMNYSRSLKSHVMYWMTLKEIVNDKHK